MMPKPLYRINSDRSKPWNELPPLPLAEELYKTVEVMEQAVVRRPDR